MAKSPKSPPPIPLKSFDAKEMIAALEERNTHIRELEREVQRLGKEIGKMAGEIDDAQQETKRVRAYWEEARGDVAARNKTIAELQEKIALVDGTADRQRAEATMARNRVLEGQLGDLQETVAYLRGYVDHTLGHKPQLTDPDFREVRPQSMGEREDLENLIINRKLGR